jgi:hypothetical protein
MRILGVVLLTGLLVSLGFAVAPIGAISGDAPFQLRGSMVPVAGVPSWPVVAGDEIATDAGSATLRLHDGSVVTLAKRSQAKIEQENGQMVLRLKSGTMEYNVAKGSTLHIINRTSPVPVQPGVVKTISTKPGETSVIHPAASTVVLSGISGYRR